MFTYVYLSINKGLHLIIFFFCSSQLLIIQLLGFVISIKNEEINKL